MSRSESAAWRSGWLGIDYGEESHGFVDLSTGPDGAADAKIHRLGSNGEVYSTFRLRHDPEHRRVDLLENVSEEFALDDDDEPDPESGWTVDASASVPADLAARLSAEAPPDQIFTAMASLHAWMFVVLDDGSNLAWDHYGLPGPNPDQLWRPVDLRSGPSPFAYRSGPPPVPVGPGLRQVWHATGPDGAGYLADLGPLHLFVTTTTGAWTPLFVPEQLTGYQQGAAVDIDEVERPTRDVLLAKIAFLTGPSPIS